MNETEAGGASIFDVAPPIPRKLRVLLVDDDPLVVASTTGMLEELGHDSIHTAASGDEALAVLRQGGDFDLLLTDYMMPGMSGYNLRHRRRRFVHRCQSCWQADSRSLTG